MQRFQRTFAAAVAAAALLGSAAFSANAQTAAPTAAPQHATAHAGHGHRAPADFAKLRAERMDHLKTILQIQPSQQAAWDQYVKATTPAPRDKAQRQQRPDLRKLTTPERLDLAQKLRKERSAKAEQREQATRSFYASLNNSQQQAFDAIHTQRHAMHKAGHGKRWQGHPSARHDAAHKGHHRMHQPAPVAPSASAA